MKVIFMGTPDFAVPTLKKLIENHQVIGVFTQPDRPKGRGQKLQSSPVKIIAQEHDIPVYQPEKIRKEPQFIKILSEMAPDVIVVVAYGQILPKSVLEIPRFGCINVHASLLPDLRGAAPINWAIIRGYSRTGVTTMLMDEGLDTGDMLLKMEVEIGEDETAEELHDKLMGIGGDILIKTLRGIETGNIDFVRQDNSKSSYAPMLNKDLGHIEWKEDCDTIYNLIRGVTPWPGAYSFYNQDTIKIWKCRKNASANHSNPGEIIEVSKEGIKIACGRGEIIIKELQTVGSKKMDVASYLNGHTIIKGTKLQ